ncbi:MAG: VWA domain-containing protein [Burkholderiales bacterium]
MRIHALPLVLLAAASAVAQEKPAEPQSPPPQTPVFEVGVDIVAVDVSVVDAQGKPLVGLAPEDFEVLVDGKPRNVVSTEYLGRELEAPQRPKPQAAHYTSNESTPSGRLVLLLVDRGNIGKGAGRLAMKSASRFLGTLPPSDRVGLAVIPGPGPNIEFTDDHASIQKALEHIVGQADRAGYQVPLSEAIALIKQNDQMRWASFVNLECGQYLLAEQLAACREQMEVEARQVYLNYRERSVQSKGSLAAVLASLQGIPGPKTVVLVSEGLGTETAAEVRILAEAAANAQVTLFVLLLDSSGVDAAYEKTQLATPEERDMETRSLYDLAGLARGAVLPLVGSADAAFQRIAHELMGYYMVGFEPAATDRDGKSHKVQVKVRREQVTVRARGVLSLPTAPPSAQQSITTSLRSPLVESGLGIRVASWARPAPGGKVRLLLAAEVARASRTVSVGYALVAGGNKVVASKLVEGLRAPEGEPVSFASEALVDPGTYTLRLAAVDAAGHRGSVHHETKAAVTTAGGLLISDLVLAAPGSGAPRPVVDLDAGASGLLALVELSGSDVAKAAVALELAETETGAALLRVPAEAGEPDKDGVRMAHVTVASGLLPPGDYVARAAVSADGKPVATQTRPFHITLPPAGARSQRAPLAALIAEQRPYDRAELLSPELLAHFVGRMSELVPGPAPEGVAAAVEEARAGRPEAMLARLSSGKEDARVAFLRGVSYYAAGNFSAAQTQLLSALRARSDFLPAAVYMGACYAAGGKDLEAIGAWQTALIGETGSPTLYAVLADALLRVREADQALAILDEGLAQFPQDEGLRRRLGMAHAMAGHSDEALTLLSTWVDAHPEDTRALFATLALLFEGFSRHATGGARLEEQQRLKRYAKSYIDGNGPNREVVERWLRYLESGG